MTNQTYITENTELHLYMHKMAERARKITMKMNNKYHCQKKVRQLFFKLTQEQPDSTFSLFPPFTTDYTARSNIMWIATWALNTLVAKGKTTDWEVHMLGQAVGAHTNATHGMTLSAVSIPYYKYIMPYGLDKFVRYAVNVWGVDEKDKSKEEIALEGLESMKNWLKQIGLVLNLTDLGVTKDMIENIADSTLIMEGGYKVLDRQDIISILKASL